MPIIYTYPSATPTADDLLVFSDVSATDPAKDTRKCTIGDLVTLIGALVPGGGTVTSVDVSGGASGLVFTGGPITTTGTITLASGQLIVANGGTGAATHTNGYFLKGAGASPITSQQYIDLTADVMDVLPELNGGTGHGVYAVGDILYASGTTTLSRLPGAGAGTLVLTSGGVGVAPSWAAPSTAGLVTTFNVNGTALPGLTPTVATSGAIVLAGTLGVGGGGTGATTLTSGYFLKGAGTSPVTTQQYIDLTSDVTGILPVANGGTGAATLTDGGILLGSGTAAITATAQPTDGQLLIGDTSSDPVLATLTAGSNISIVNGAGTITIASTAGAPSFVNYDNQLTLRGGTSGTYTPNVSRLAYYWTLGQYIYLQFFLSWNSAHSCVGTMIMENLPLSAIVPTGATLALGSCVMTVNDGTGTAGDATGAPTTGRCGVTAGDEIIFRSHNGLSGIFFDSLWANLDGDHVGNYILAGTASWLKS